MRPKLLLMMGETILVLMSFSRGILCLTYIFWPAEATLLAEIKKSHGNKEDNRQHQRLLLARWSLSKRCSRLYLRDILNDYEEPDWREISRFRARNTTLMYF